MPQLAMLASQVSKQAKCSGPDEPKGGRLRDWRCGFLRDDERAGDRLHSAIPDIGVAAESERTEQERRIRVGAAKQNWSGERNAATGCTAGVEEGNRPA